jgi:hypothetical protein
LKYVFRLALVEVGLMRSVSERLELGVRPSAARSKFLPRL